MSSSWAQAPVRQSSSYARRTNGALTARKTKDQTKDEEMKRDELTNGRDGGDDFTKLELIQDGGLTGSVQTDHKNTHFLLAEEARKQFRDGETHVGTKMRS